MSPVNSGFWLPLCTMPTRSKNDVPDYAVIELLVQIGEVRVSRQQPIITGLCKITVQALN